MRVLRPSSEDEMVAVFLRGELGSERFAPGFPDDVQWSRVALTPDEIGAVRSINWSDWLEISGGTRRPADAANRIRSGFEASGVANDGFHELAAELRQGRVWSELIVVSAREQGDDDVLEGHG